jgi:hypothetical protein
MLFGYFSDNNPDSADPNGKYLRGAFWNGDKYDWDGQWFLEVDLGDPCSWHEPNVILEAGDDYWCPEGLTTIATGEYIGTPAYVAFDQIETRTGVFDPNDPAYLDLTVKNQQYGAVTIDPDLPDANDPNTSSARLCRYTNGTEIVLVAEPVDGKSFNRWRIFDPNHPDDGNYATLDSNAVLYLTMDEDKIVEASFKCGSSVPPFVAMTFLALGLGVVVRRLGLVGW